MNNCKITLKPLPKKTKYPGYSDAGVRDLFGSLKVSPKVTFDRKALESFPTSHKGKMSISGYQPKMSASVVDGSLVLGKENGTYIIKPSPAQFPHLAENEHAIMTLARQCKFETPPFGLIVLDNDELAFVIKRYDRHDGAKFHQEQLDSAMGLNDKFGVEDGKHVVSYARAGRFITANLKLVNQYADFYRRVIFSYVVGNNDHHLRNFSLLFKPDVDLPVLSPVYDVVSVEPYDAYSRAHYLALVLLIGEEDGYDEEMETGFDRKYGQYDRFDFIQFGMDIGLKSQAAIKLLDNLLLSIEKALPSVHTSFIHDDHKQCVIDVINHRVGILRDTNMS